MPVQHCWTFWLFKEKPDTWMYHVQFLDFLNVSTNSPKMSTPFRHSVKSCLAVACPFATLRSSLWALFGTGVKSEGEHFPRHFPESWDSPQFGALEPRSYGALTQIYGASSTCGSASSPMADTSRSRVEQGPGRSPAGCTDCSLLPASLLMPTLPR